MSRPRSLPCAANQVAQSLAEASQDPRGLSPLECAALAHLLDEALVIAAPVAPPPVVVSLDWWRTGKPARP
jgi:hypothetical protein